MLVTRRVKVALETGNPAWDSLSLTSLQIFLMDAGAGKTFSPASYSQVCSEEALITLKCLFYYSEIIFCPGENMLKDGILHL